MKLTECPRASVYVQPLRSLLSAIGGTSVVLGLVAMATDVDSLYAGMKAMVCIVGNNSIAIKEMERMGGFKVSWLLSMTIWVLCADSLLFSKYQ